MPNGFPPEIAVSVRRPVLSGEFNSEDVVLKAVLQPLDERDEEIAAIQAGLGDMQAGRVHDLSDVDVMLRQRHGIGAGQ